MKAPEMGMVMPESHRNTGITHENGRGRIGQLSVQSYCGNAFPSQKL